MCIYEAAGCIDVGCEAVRWSGVCWRAGGWGGERRRRIVDGFFGLRKLAMHRGKIVHFDVCTGSTSA